MGDLETRHEYRFWRDFYKEFSGEWKKVLKWIAKIRTKGKPVGGVTFAASLAIIVFMVPFAVATLLLLLFPREFWN